MVILNVLHRIAHLLRFIFGLKWIVFAVSHPIFSILFFSGLTSLLYVTYLDWKEGQISSVHREAGEIERWVKENKGKVVFVGVLMILLSVFVLGGSGGSSERVDLEPVTPEPDAQVVTPTPTPESNFGFYIDITENSVGRCGLSVCVNATATITNIGSLSARSLSVDVELFVNVAGAKQTIWQDTETVGDLDPGESYSTTKKIEIGLSKALLVKNNGCAFSSQFKVNYDTGQKIYTNSTDLPRSKCDII